MVATNDDLLLELQEQTKQLKVIKRLIKGTYINQETANNLDNGV